MNSNKYFESPNFESRKSSYRLHYQNEFERKLMAFFDASAEVIDYFQPLMEILVDGAEATINIDFWLECKDKIILVHLVDDSLPISDKGLEQGRVFCRKNDFGFLVLHQAESSASETIQTKLF